MKNGVANFSGLVGVDAIPSSAVTLRFVVTNLAVAISGSATVSMRSCLSGEFLRNSECLPCPRGTFSEGGLPTSCQQCGPGRFQDETGQGSCKCCAAGSAMALNGSVACVSCSRGTAQNQTCQRSCVQCENDFEAPDVGLSVCLACRGGEHTNPSIGFEKCRSCPSNQYAASNPSTGKFLACDVCPKHATCTGGSLVVADPGYWVSFDQTGRVLSYPCPDGFCLGSNQCAAGRKEAAINPLCGACLGKLSGFWFVCRL